MRIGPPSSNVTPHAGPGSQQQRLTRHTAAAVYFETDPILNSNIRRPRGRTPPAPAAVGTGRPGIELGVAG